MQDYRKVIKFGNSSFVISLPKEWINKHNITKGNTLYFQETEKSDLHLSVKDTEEKEKQKIVHLNIDGMSSKEIELEIIATYVKDFSRIIFTGDEVANRYQEIRDLLQSLVAVEVIEQTRDRIIAKDFLSMDKVQLDDLRKRLDIVVKSMIVDSRLGMGKENYENVNNRDKDANKFSYVILRVIRRGMEKPSIRRSMGSALLELVHEQQTVLTMENIADMAKRISREDARSTLSKQEIESLNRIHDMLLENYQDAIKAYRTKNYALACKSFSQNKKTQIACDALKGKLKTKSTEKIMHLLREMSNKMASLSEVGFMNVDSTISKITHEPDDQKLL